MLASGRSPQVLLCASSQTGSSVECWSLRKEGLPVNNVFQQLSPVGEPVGGRGGRLSLGKLGSGGEVLPTATWTAPARASHGDRVPGGVEVPGPEHSGRGRTSVLKPGRRPAPLASRGETGWRLS